MKKISSILVLVIVTTFIVFSQENSDKMGWWKEAKFGLFIHWGVYSVPAGMYNEKEYAGGSEWIMNYGKIPVKEYKEYANKFNPIKYDPESWVKLAKEAGMKYLVITAKHHDGFALFDSKVTDWDVVDATPYGKDLLKPLADACHKENLPLGLYYSQAQDWCHPGGAARRGHWDKAQDGSMDAYIEKIAVPQVKEILSNFGDVDILWWDSPDSMNVKRARKFLPVINQYPNLITNDRLGGHIHGDTETPEQFIPATGFPGRNWETCMTMNDSWGYKSYDANWKSTKELIQNLIDIVSKGGNYLLNIGPTSEGLVPKPSIKRLKEIGEWMEVNGESIYGTTASPFPFLSWGKATTKGNTVYLHVFDWPENGKLPVPVLNKIKKAYLLAKPSIKLKVDKQEEKSIIHLKGEAIDPISSVVVVELDGAPEVLPIPTNGKTAKASSEKEGTSTASLFNGDPKDKWQPADDDKTPWIEVDLGEVTTIAACSVVEPWNPWLKKGQQILIQYKSGDDWIKASEFTTNGSGHIQKMEPVTSRYFRLTILQAKEPLINEWILYRAE